MNIIKEVGFLKVIKYVIFTFWEIIFHVLVFSPLRVFWLRVGGAKIGDNTLLGNLYFMNLYRRGLRGMKVGKNCFIGNRVVFDLADEIEIGNEVTVADEAFILTHTNVGYKNHPLQKYFPNYCLKVVVNNGAFIGIRATVLPGVIIGENSAAGACSLVKQNIPSHELHVGIPAVFKRKLL